MENNCRAQEVYSFYEKQKKSIKDKYDLAKLIKETFPMLTTSLIVRVTGWPSYRYYKNNKKINKSERERITKDRESRILNEEIKIQERDRRISSEIDAFKAKIKQEKRDGRERVRQERKDLLTNINKLSIFYLNQKEIIDDKFVLAKTIKEAFPMLKSISIIRATGWKQYRFYLKTKEERLAIKIAQKGFRKTTNTKKKDLIIKIKNEFGGKCSCCGYNKYLGALEFHHLDPNDKDINISQCSKEEDMRKEAEKCILLCSNCHREEHERLRNLE